MQVSRDKSSPLNQTNDRDRDREFHTSPTTYQLQAMHTGRLTHYGPNMYRTTIQQKRGALDNQQPIVAPVGIKDSFRLIFVAMFHFMCS